MPTKLHLSKQKMFHYKILTASDTNKIHLQQFNANQITIQGTILQLCKAAASTD